MKATDILNAVKKVIDEVDEDKTIEVSNGNLDSLINECIQNAVTSVHSSADTSLLEGKTAQIIPSFVDKCGKVTLPNDFLRLAYFKMGDWSCAVTSMINDDSAEYRMQKDKYTMGTPENPVCAFIQGMNMMEFYSTESSEVVFRYLPFPEVDSNGDIYVCPKLKAAVVYYTAGLTLASFGDARSENMFQIAKSYM